MAVTRVLIIFFIFNLCVYVSKGETDSAGRCFCKLEGRIDDCTCNVDTVDYFNNMKIYPRLRSLLLKDFFRYVKVNLNRNCPFWADDGKCAFRACSVQSCPEEQLPPGLKGEDMSIRDGKQKYLKETQDKDSCDENNGGLGAINETISDENYEGFQRWQKHDDSQDNFCEMDDQLSSDVQYYDLLLNPERYTGYKGPSAHRIWNSIYEENCFKFGSGYGPYTTSKNLNAMCLEKRVFYRAISGLHTSINVHLCAQYFTPGKNGFEEGGWDFNVKEFKQKFDPSYTFDEGPHWLKNLYFLYLFELRALAKAAPYLENETFYTGNEQDDKEVRAVVKELLNIVKSFPDHFNEIDMFSSVNRQAQKLKEEFRLHFLNISRIMDCVGCDKCKLWGKIQVQGLGTAFKILFSGRSGADFTLPQMKKGKFQLTRTEIASLFNAFGRLSSSVYYLENFRKLLNSSGKL